MLESILRCGLDINVGSPGLKETFFFMRKGAGVPAVAAVAVAVSVDCVDCVVAAEHSESVRIRVRVFSSFPSNEQVEKTGESPSVVEGNDVDENTESTEERALDVDDVEEFLLFNIRLLLSIGISAY